jgi:hypothetical protein
MGKPWNRLKSISKGEYDIVQSSVCIGEFVFYLYYTDYALCSLMKPTSPNWGNAWLVPCPNPVSVGSHMTSVKMTY